MSVSDELRDIEPKASKGGKTVKNAAKELTVQAQTVDSTEVVKPAQVDVDPTNALEDAQHKALEATVQAAATMGDSTSGLFQKVTAKLEAKRSERDEKLAEQIADRVFQEENQVLGKSFTGLLNYVAAFDPYKGTPLEGITGASTVVDINAMLATPSPSQLPSAG